MERGRPDDRPQQSTRAGDARSSEGGRPKRTTQQRLVGLSQESREGHAGASTLLCSPSLLLPPREPTQSRGVQTSVAEAHYNPGVFGDDATHGMIWLSPPSNPEAEARGEYREALTAQEEGFFHSLH